MMIIMLLEIKKKWKIKIIDEIEEAKSVENKIEVEGEL